MKFLNNVVAPYNFTIKEISKPRGSPTKEKPLNVTPNNIMSQKNTTTKQPKNSMFNSSTYAMPGILIWDCTLQFSQTGLRTAPSDWEQPAHTPPNRHLTLNNRWQIELMDVVN